MPHLSVLLRITLNINSPSSTSHSNLALKMSAPRLILHYLNRSRAHRVLWLLEECKLEYKLLTYTRLPDQTAPAALKKIHPLGKSPVLEVWEGERQRVLAESAYIVESVAERFGAAVGLKRGTEGGRGKDEKEEERERERFYMHYSEGSLMNLVGTGALKNGWSFSSLIDLSLPLVYLP